MHISSNNYHLLADKQEPYIYVYIYIYARLIIRKNGRLAEKGQDRKTKRTRQKKKRGDRKGESNGSPEIPDRRMTSDIPGLLSGDVYQ